MIERMHSDHPEPTTEGVERKKGYATLARRAVEDAKSMLSNLLPEGMWDIPSMEAHVADAKRIADELEALSEKLKKDAE